MNPFESANRATKRERLVMALDDQFHMMGITPSREGVRIAEALRGWTRDQWAVLAVGIGVNPPSEITIGQIIDSYERRQLRAVRRAS